MLLFVVVIFSKTSAVDALKHRVVAIVVICTCLYPGIKNYLSSYCGWYLWVNNPHEISYRVALKHPDKFYFPWQPLGALIADGKLYHIDPGLQMDPITESSNYSDSVIEKFLPNKPFIIAVRKYGRESYLVKKLNSLQIAADDLPLEIKSWNIYLSK
jgi:hypothetical protein